MTLGKAPGRTPLVNGSVTPTTTGSSPRAPWLRRVKYALRRMVHNGSYGPRSRTALVRNRPYGPWARPRSLRLLRTASAADPRPAERSDSPSRVDWRLHRLGIAPVAAALVAFAMTTPVGASAADTCPNAQLRTGAAANLPDCRAYELVTPSDTNGVPPYGGVGQSIDFVTQNGPAFSSPLAAANGDSYLFSTPASPLPATDAPGYGNQYRAKRGPTGWSTSLWGPNGVQAGIDQPGGFSADHDYWSFLVDHFESRYSGTLDLDNSTGEAQWIRYPDGSMHLVGEGTVPASPDTDGYPNGFADDSTARPDWISPEGDHIIFDTGAQFGAHVQLTPDAPPTGTPAVYDRTPAGLHVISLLPGDVTPTAASTFEGASDDGSTVLFGNGGRLYARVDGTSTYPVADGSTLPLNGTLTCSASPADAPTKQFQWLRNGAPIPGATNSTYRATAADAGDVIQCQVFVLNANAGTTDVSEPGVVVAPAPAAPAPVATGGSTTPSQSATLTVGGAGGQTLTCDNGTWSGSPSFTYQWFRNAVPLSGNGADTDTYTVQAADLATPAVFQCAVTATNGSGSATQVSQNVATSPAPNPAAPVAGAQTSNAIPSPGGVSDDGSKVFYAQARNLYAFDTRTQQTTPITSSGDAQLVEPSPDGSPVYFISPSQLDGSKGTQGADNLYVWDGSATTFVATLDPGDLDRFRFCGPSCDQFGLTSWAAVPLGSISADPAKNGPAAEQASRISPDGTKLLFESKARLTSYDNGGHFELYRYDTADRGIVCVSCGPSGSPAAGDARLLDYDFHFIGSYTTVANMSDGGQTVFFESSDSLLPQDSNGVEDVYEWEADDTGSCHSSAQNGGCLSLISSGESSQPSFITGATPDGSNVFIFTADRLVAGGQEPGVPGIYDARVDGGFPPPSTSSAPCVGDACQSAPSGPPPGPVVASVTFSGPGNTTPPPRASMLTRTVRGTRFVVRVRVPAKGLVTITGSGIRGVRDSLRRAGTYRLHLRLTARARGTLRRRHRLRLRLRIAYASGTEHVQTTTVRLAVRPAHRHRPGPRPARTRGGAR